MKLTDSALRWVPQQILHDGILDLSENSNINQNSSHKIFIDAQPQKSS